MKLELMLIQDRRSYCTWQFSRLRVDGIKPALDDFVDACKRMMLPKCFYDMPFYLQITLESESDWLIQRRFMLVREHLENKHFLPQFILNDLELNNFAAREMNRAEEQSG